MSDDLGVAAGLVRLSFLVQSVYAKVCAAHDLTPPQAQLLCVLSDSPRGMAELARTLRLEKSSLTGLVDRAERRGLVARVASKQDGRAVTVALTEPGARIAEVFHEDATLRLEETVACLPGAERELFAAIASRIVDEQAVPEVFADTTAGRTAHADHLP